MTNQIEMSPLAMQALEDGTLDYVSSISNFSPMFWSPLAGGRLFAEDDKAKRVRAALDSNVADEVGLNSIDQVVYAWLLTLPCSPAIILGTGKLGAY